MEPVQRLRFDNDNTAGFDLFSGNKVLTPTMYRSRIAAARQAVSMDCYYSYQDEDDQNSRTKSQLLGKYYKIYMRLSSVLYSKQLSEAILFTIIFNRKGSLQRRQNSRQGSYKKD